VPLFSVHGGVCDCGDASCKQPGKHPRIHKGLLNASLEPWRLRQWFLRSPMPNIAIATGASQLGVLDIDPRKDGLESLRRLGVDTTGSGKVRTGDGWHLYFQGPVPTSVGQLGRGLDVRGIGGYVVAPPSRHASGATYRWERLSLPLPRWPFKPPSAESAPPPIGEAILEGTRNATLFSLACSLHMRETPGALVHRLIDIVNREACQPPLDSVEVHRIVSNVLRRPRRGPTLGGAHA